MHYPNMHGMRMFGMEVSVTFIPSEFVVAVNAQIKVSLNVNSGIDYHTKFLLSSAFT